MIRQYIGARYVTKIYENSLDPSSAEWEGSRSYEPLTLVTYLNSSYLSKKEVPASVGDPASNPDYWVITGAYNGQIATLQAQIDAIKGELAGGVIFIGDSYGSVNSYQYPATLRSLLQKTQDVDFFYSAAGGSGFIGNGIAQTFLQQLQGLTIPDPDSIKNIVVVGGINDGSSSTNDILTAISNFMTYVRATYKNATVHIGYITRSFDHPTIWGQYSTVLVAYKNGALSNGACAIDDAPVWLQYGYIDSDGLHPTATGSNLLAWNTSNYLKGSKGNYCIGMTTVSLTFDQTGISSGNPASFKLGQIHNGYWTVTIGDWLLGCTGIDGSSFTTGLKIASINQSFIDSVDYSVGSICIPVQVRFVEGGNNVWRTMIANVKITTDGIYLKMKCPDLYTTSITAIWFTAVQTAILDPMTC